MFEIKHDKFTVFLYEIEGLTKPAGLKLFGQKILDALMTRLLPECTRDGGIWEMERHTYKICELQPKEPGKRGRHKRVVLMDWHNLPTEELHQLRKMLEPRLQPNQVSELDSKIVARGSAVQEEPEDNEDGMDSAEPPESPEGAEEPEEAAVELDDVDLPDDAEAATNPVVATKFSIRMLWMAQKRHADASEELCKRTSALTEKTLEQWKKVDAALTEVSALRREMLKERAAEQPKPSSGMSMQDIMEIMRTGATIWREVNGPSRGGGPSEV